MHKWVCFQSNQEGHQSPTNSHVRTCELWSQSDMDEKPVCKPGACYANDLHCFLGFCLFLYVFFVGGGGEGVKGWSTAASVKHTHTHTLFALTVYHAKEHQLGHFRQREPIIFVYSLHCKQIYIERNARHKGPFWKMGAEEGRGVICVIFAGIYYLTVRQ